MPPSPTSKIQKDKTSSGLLEDVGIKTRGTKQAPTYAIYAVDRHVGKTLSFWHHLPMAVDSNGHVADGDTGVQVTFVCEIPKQTRAKMEVCTDEPWNPIRQDKNSDGTLRFYSSPIPWNYGMIPQTWEAPAHKWSAIYGLPGDGDPLDVIEVGHQRCKTGSVHAVKVLGAYALIDGKEVDWKIVAIRADDPLAESMQDLADMEQVLPGQLAAIHDWFRDYKVPDGKPPNRYGFGGKPQDVKVAVRVINLAHDLYLRQYGEYGRYARSCQTPEP